MTTARRALPAALWTLQWTLATTFFLLGLLKVGLPLDDLQQRLHLLAGAAPARLGQAGWLEVAAALLIVVPAATGFAPRLTPVAAAYLAVTVGLGAVLHGGASGLGLPGPDLLLALAAGAVAVGRGLLLPVAPIELGPEPGAAPRPLRVVKSGRGPARAAPDPTPALPARRRAGQQPGRVVGTR